MRPLRSRHPLKLIFAFASITALSGCSRGPSPPAAALASFSGDRILNHIRILSSDEFEGRGPGSHGEQLTIKYLEDQYRSAGLEPGNPDGTYLQSVPLVGITPDPGMKLTLAGHGRSLEPKFQDDFVAWSKRVTETSSVDADLIFVGYGVQAPEFRWDDFKGVDVKGKILVVLINDPPVPDPADPSKLDPKTFGGAAMTYYGRWTYKFEKAAQMGAAGCVIIHQTDRAGYPWEVVRDSWAGTQFDLATVDKNLGRLAVESWITSDFATKLFRAAGQDLDKLIAASARRDFKPVPLGIHAKLTIHNALRTIDSHNVIAKLMGSDPDLKKSYVIYTAHWDHFGIGPEVNGDKIYHGAVDNASGSAALLEIARAYKALRRPPRRTILFLSVTAEEQGLLGSRYYAEHPLYPLARTALNINMDGMNVIGRTSDIVQIGRGASTLDDVVDAVAAEQGRVVKLDPEPEKGLYYRSDHFEFAKNGVPAFDPDQGVDVIGKPEGWGLEARRKFTAERYHKPADKIQPDWDLSGAVQDCQLYFLVGYRVANDPRIPAWKPGAEFKAVRDASLIAAGVAP
ncbi:MAG TPA: M20/M25/M40 family metallo-hydrolase [Candidatus Acidoferrales bacterium]|jgi:Zn-dependent M28 family amino/carboxypeptidase|nr:M20/M25/M40 family metallo-hydrolase [Candidatus Acidoferrales bacterium]